MSDLSCFVAFQVPTAIGARRSMVKGFTGATACITEYNQSWARGSSCLEDNLGVDVGEFSVFVSLADQVSGRVKLADREGEAVKTGRGGKSRHPGVSRQKSVDMG